MNRYVYLVEARPVNDAGEEQIQRWSCGQIVGIPYGGVAWVNCLMPATGESDGPFTYSAEIPLDTTVGGRSAIGYGSLKLNMAFTGTWAMTTLGLLHWDARPLRIWRIQVDASDRETGAAFTTDDPPMFIGTTDTPTLGLVDGTVPIFDRSRLLDVPLQETKYLGTGGLEGGEDLKGVVKPIGIGRVFHAEPRALDHAQPGKLILNEGTPEEEEVDTFNARVFQFSDGAVDAIQPPSIYERALQFDDVTTGSDVYAWSPVAGAVKLDLARGVGRTGSTPVGVLTVVFIGDPEGLLPRNEFGLAITTHGNVMRVALRLRNRIAAEWIDEDALAALDTAEDALCGVFVADERTVAAVLDQLAQSVGAAWGFTPAGVFTVRQVGFRASVATFTTLLSDLRPVPLPPPVWRYSYGYRPVERVLTDSDIGDAQVLPANRALLSEPHRTAVTVASDVQAVRLLARESEVVGRILELAPAASEGSRQHRLLQQHRRQYVIRVWRTFGTLREGDTVTLQTSGFGLEAGKDFLVRRIEWFPSLLPDEDEAELTLWGPFVVGEDVRLAA